MPMDRSGGSQAAGSTRSSATAVPGAAERDFIRRVAWRRMLIRVPCGPHGPFRVGTGTARKPIGHPCRPRRVRVYGRVRSTWWHCHLEASWAAALHSTQLQRPRGQDHLLHDSSCAGPLSPPHPPPFKGRSASLCRCATAALMLPRRLPLPTRTRRHAHPHSMSSRTCLRCGPLVGLEMPFTAVPAGSLAVQAGTDPLRSQSRASGAARSRIGRTRLRRAAPPREGCAGRVNRAGPGRLGGRRCWP